MRHGWLNAFWRFAGRALTLGIAGLMLLAGLGAAVGLAAPAVPPRAPRVNHIVPDWMSAATAAELNLGFNVLVPDSVPAPFSGEPDVEAGDGYYRLYWAVYGGPPTFLEITGTVGGTIPAYSEYNRNNQLTVNASVQGNDAYHDLTPIYDLVYWKAGDVVYSVDSRNLSDTDTLSVANALDVLTPASGGGSGNGGASGGETPVSETPAGQTPAPSPALDLPGTVNAGQTVAITVSGAARATLEAGDGTFVDTGGATVENVSDGTYRWTAPATSDNETVSIRLIEPDNGDWLASAQITVTGQAEPVTAAAPPATAPPPPTSAPAATTETTPGPAPPASSDEGANSSAGVPPPTPTAATEAVRAAKAPTAPPTPTKSFFDAMATSTPRPDGQSGDGTGGSRKAVVFPTIAVSPTESVFASLPTSTPRPAGQPGDGTWGDQRAGPSMTPPAAPTPRGQAPTATVAVANRVAVTAVIGPEGGELVNPAGATLDVPAGALPSDATVRLAPVADARLPVVAGVDLIPGSGFDITVAPVRGQQPVILQKPVTLTLKLDENQWRQGTVIYWVHGSQLTPVARSHLSATAATAPLPHFSRYVAGVPGQNDSPAPNRLAWILAAIGALVVGGLLLAMLLLARAQRRRRRS